MYSNIYNAGINKKKWQVDNRLLGRTDILTTNRIRVVQNENLWESLSIVS